MVKANKPIMEINEKNYEKSDFQKMFDRLNNYDEEGNPEKNIKDKETA